MVSARFNALGTVFDCLQPILVPRTLAERRQLPDVMAAIREVANATRDVSPPIVIFPYVLLRSCIGNMQYLQLKSVGVNMKCGARHHDMTLLHEPCAWVRSIALKVFNAAAVSL